MVIKKVWQNDTGFVLAEAIVVSIFVLGMFTFLAINLFPLIGKYERVSYYDNTQEVYLANTLYDTLIQTNEISQISKGIYEFRKDANENLTILYNGAILNSSHPFSSAYNQDLIVTYLEIEKILIFQGSYSAYQNLERSMREYYNYFKNKNKNFNQTAMLIEFENGMFANVIME